MQRMTTRGLWIWIGALVALTSAVVFYWVPVRQVVKTVQYPVTRTVKYSFTVKNPNNYPINHSEFWVYSPVSKSSFQQLSSLISDHPYSEEKDPLGNKRMKFIIDSLPPYGLKNITVTATVNLSEQGNRIEESQDLSYLSDEKMIALNDARIKRLAGRLKANTPRETVKRIYDWITKNIKRTGYQKQDLGARYALTHKSGDCTEFMYLFSALARANGIPTRNLSGFTARENRVLRAADYHNWNEVLIDGEWHLVDTEKQVFMNNASEYIAMRLIGDPAFRQSVDAQSFFASSRDIRVSMR